jgi:hypothetical protein
LGLFVAQAGIPKLGQSARLARLPFCQLLHVLATARLLTLRTLACTTPPFDESPGP